MGSPQLRVQSGILPSTPHPHSSRPAQLRVRREARPLLGGLVSDLASPFINFFRPRPRKRPARPQASHHHQRPAASYHRPSPSYPAPPVQAHYVPAPAPPQPQIPLLPSPTPRPRTLLPWLLRTRLPVRSQQWL